MTERLHTGGQHLRGGSLRLVGMALSRFQPLTGGSPAHIGGPVSLSQLLKPRADGRKAIIDLPPAAWPGLRLALHASKHA